MTKIKPRRRHKNSKFGCPNCKRRRIKCSEELPECANCIKNAQKCGYLTWDEESLDTFRKHKADRERLLREKRLLSSSDGSTSTNHEWLNEGIQLKNSSSQVNSIKLQVSKSSLNQEVVFPTHSHVTESASNKQDYNSNVSSVLGANSDSEFVYNNPPAKSLFTPMDSHQLGSDHSRSESFESVNNKISNSNLASSKELYFPSKTAIENFERFKHIQCSAGADLSNYLQPATENIFFPNHYSGLNLQPEKIPEESDDYFNLTAESVSQSKMNFENAKTILIGNDSLINQTEQQKGILLDYSDFGLTNTDIMQPNITPNNCIPMEPRGMQDRTLMKFHSSGNINENERDPSLMNTKFHSTGNIMNNGGMVNGRMDQDRGIENYKGVDNYRGGNHGRVIDFTRENTDMYPNSALPVSNYSFSGAFPTRPEYTGDDVHIQRSLEDSRVKGKYPPEIQLSIEELSRKLIEFEKGRSQGESYDIDGNRIDARLELDLLQCNSHR